MNRQSKSKRTLMHNKYMMLFVVLFSMITGCAGDDDATAWVEADYEKYTYTTYQDFAAFNVKIDANKIDESLMNAAIFFETNRQRAKYEVPAFRYYAKLSSAAQGHSEDMVAQDFFSHVSPVVGKEQLTDRMKKAGVTNEYVGENIIQGFVLQIGEEAYYPPTATESNFRKLDGSIIEMYTYAGFAAYLVQRWMDSPGHRRNILDPEFKQLGCGSAFYFDKSTANPIPSMKCTQCFSN